jgi:signal transduction histidine kinase
MALASLAIVVLWQSLARAARESRVQRERALDVQAYRLEQRLRDPALLALATPSHRFAVVAGEIVRESGFASLERPAPFDPERELDVVLRENLARAEAASDPAGVVAGLLPLLTDAAATPRASDWLRARMAWAAYRAQDHERLREVLVRGFEHDPDAHLSATLLSMRQERETLGAASVPVELGVALASASASAAAQFVARAPELLSASGATAIDFEAMLREVEDRREVLRRIVPLTPELARAVEPIVRTHEDRVLLYQPRSGEGALVELAAVQRALNDDPRFALELAAETTATEFERDLLARRLRLSITALEDDLFAAQRSLLAVGAALALLCGVGSILALRAQRAERRAARLQADFLTTVTHELKTPLAGIRLVAELLSDGHVDRDDDRERWLRRLVAESARLGMLLENVLDLGRFERGEIRLRSEPVAVDDLVEDTVGMLRPLLERDGCELRVGELPPVQVLGDRQALQQVLMNLGDNARKYGRSPVVIEATEDGAAVTLTVSDQGDGIPADEESTIFERFRRGRAHRDGSIPGVGLGLHLCRTIVSSLGGDLTVKGARFTIRLQKSDVEARTGGST